MRKINANLGHIFKIISKRLKILDFLWLKLKKKKLPETRVRSNEKKKIYFGF